MRIKLEDIDHYDEDGNEDANEVVNDINPQDYEQ